jgi:hypothetical protein
MAISPRKLAANQQNARRSTGPRTPTGKARVKHNALKHGLLAKEVIVPLGDEYKKRAEFDHLLDDLCQHYAPVGPIEAMLVDRIAVAYWRLRRATRAEVGELIVEIDNAPGFDGVPFLSGIAARLRTQVEAADQNFDFVTWLQNNEDVLPDLGWDLKEVAAYINNLRSDERKPWLLQALEEEEQECTERERAQIWLIDRQNRALLVQRSLPGSSEAVAKILRYETMIDRQLYRAMAELEKLQAARRRTSSPASGPTPAV